MYLYLFLILPHVELLRFHAMPPTIEEKGANGDGMDLVSLLSSSDFILEGTVGKTLETFLEAGGDTSKAVEALSNGYCGRAQICNTLVSWLADLGEGDRGVEAMEASVAAQIERHFDPDGADGIFAVDGESGVDWMPKLVSHRRWRKVIYQLVPQFPQCLMLNFAVRLISDAGFQSEISNVNTATQQLEIFSRVMSAEMKATMAVLSEGAYEEQKDALEEMVRVVSQTEHSYVYTTALMESIVRDERGKNACSGMIILEALREKLYGKEHESCTLRCGMLQGGDEQLPPQVLTSLVTMISKSQLNPADVYLVYQQYIMPRPPPVMLIRDESFLRLLYDALFSYDKPRVTQEFRDKYVYLLAYASSVSERPGKKQRMLCKLGLDPVRMALEKAVCLTDLPFDDMSRELSELLFLSRHPSVAAGLIHFVRSVLLSEDRLGEPPSYIYVIIDHVATGHPNMHLECFETLCQVYDKVSRDPEVAEIIMGRQRTVIDRFVHLFSVGGAILVLQKMSEMFNEAAIDASLVRYFVLEVLDMMSPPYSPSLVRILLPLVAESEIIDDVMREKMPSVKAFLNDAGHVRI